MPRRPIYLKTVSSIAPNYFILDIAQTAFLSLIQHKLRSILSILGIVCGVMAVFSVLAIGDGAEIETLRRIEQMGVKNIYVRAEKLTSKQTERSRMQQSLGLQLSDMDRLKTVNSNIKTMAATRKRLVDVVGLPENLTPQVIEATEQYAQVLGLALSSGRFVTARDVSLMNRVCVLGGAVSAALGTDGKLGKTLQIGTGIWKIVGVLQRQDRHVSENTRIYLQDVNEMIVVPLGTISRTAKDGTDPLTEMIVEVNSKENVYSVSQIVKRTLQVAHHGVDDFLVIVPLELLGQSQRIKKIFNIVFGAIGGLALVIGGIGIMNIMLANISERIREIGLRRAVGAQPYHIVIQFLLESIILTTIGGILGIAGGVGLSMGISLFAGWPVHYSIGIIFLSLSLAVVTGCCFGIYPAIKASKMDPLLALGYTV